MFADVLKRGPKRTRTIEDAEERKPRAVVKEAVRQWREQGLDVERMHAGDTGTATGGAASSSSDPAAGRDAHGIPLLPPPAPPSDFRPVPSGVARAARGSPAPQEAPVICGPGGAEPLRGTKRRADPIPTEDEELESRVRQRENKQKPINQQINDQRRKL